MNNKTALPDWNELAEKFDVWVPHLAPVGDALITAMHAEPGHHILDIASGTGEPALTLAQSMGDNVFRLVIMGSMDRHDFCISSIKRSCVHFVEPDGKIYPFETWNLFYRDSAKRRR